MKTDMPRALREATHFVNPGNHRKCCDFWPAEERCGLASRTVGESREVDAICTRKPNHTGKHYDAVLCVQWERE